MVSTREPVELAPGLWLEWRPSSPNDLAPWRLKWGDDWVWLPTAVGDALAAALGRPEPLPVMSGTAIARALRAGDEVEQYSTGETGCGNEPHWCALDDSDWWAEHIGDRAVVARLVSAPAVPSVGEPGRELPEGVHRAPDGTLLAKGCDLPSLPEGWQRSLTDQFGWGEPTGAENLTCWFRVRPAPAPEPEMVPVLEAFGRRTIDGEHITSVGQGETGIWYRTNGAGAPWPATFPPGGRVACAPLPKGDE